MLYGFKVLELQNHGRNTNHMKRDAPAKSSRPRRKAQRRASAARRGVAPARNAECVMLGEHVDPLVCHGRLTYKGTRIMVWQILDELEHGMSPDEIVKAWGGRVSKAAISESIRLARGALLNAPGDDWRGPSMAAWPHESVAMKTSTGSEEVLLRKWRKPSGSVLTFDTKVLADLPTAAFSVNSEGPSRDPRVRIGVHFPPPQSAGRLTTSHPQAASCARGVAGASPCAATRLWHGLTG